MRVVCRVEHEEAERNPGAFQPDAKCRNTSVAAFIHEGALYFHAVKEQTSPTGDGAGIASREITRDSSPR